MGTTGTVQSGSYLLEIEKFFPEIKISQEACPIWVSLVEDNKYDSPEADFFVKNHIDNLLQKDKKIDTILLACTHYPLLLNKIKLATPSSISIISQGEIVAKSLKEYLINHPEITANCSKNGVQYFYTTGDAEKFNKHGSIFFGQEIEAKKLVLS